MEKERFSDIYQISFDDRNDGYNEFIEMLDILKQKYNVIFEYGVYNGTYGENLKEMYARSNNYYGIAFEKRDVLKKNDTDSTNHFLNFLDKITKSSEKLVIVDNYIFPKKYDARYEKLLLNILNRCATNIIVTDKEYNKELFNNLKKELLKTNNSIKVIESDDFHDRFYLSDIKGFSVGTSLNGLGKRSCLIGYLPINDYLELVKELNKLEKIF